MTVVALSLSLSAALIHASWNFLAERVSGVGGSDIGDRLGGNPPKVP